MWYKPPKPFKKPNSKFLYYRWEIPADLRALNEGKQYVMQSLKTTDPAEAQRLINRKHEAVLAGFEAQTRQSDVRAKAAIDRAVDKFFAMGERALGNMDEFCYSAMLDMFLAEVVTSANEAQAPKLSEALGFAIDPLTMRVDEPLDLSLEITKHRIFEQQAITRGLALRETPRRLLSKRWWKPAAAYLESVIELAGFAWPEGSPGYDHAAEAFLRRLAEHRFAHWPTHLERALGSSATQGQADEPAPTVPAGVTTDVVRSAPVNVEREREREVPTPTPTSEVRERQLSAVFEAWAVSFLLTKKVERHKTVDEWRRAIKQFIGMHGDLDVNDITTAMVREFRKTLYRAPKYAAKEVASLSLRDQARIAAENDLPRLSAASVNKALSGIRVTLEHAREELEILTREENVAKNVASLPVTGSEAVRLPFDDGDLRAIFQQPVVTDSTGISSHTLLWLLLLGLLTGCRLNELAQLRPTNIRQDQGIWYIAIERDRKSAERGGGRKTIKTSAAERNVPVHSLLMEAGFIELAKRRSNQAWLFPDISADKYGSRATRASRVLNDYFDSVGITDSEKVYHSFRHTIRRRMRGVVDKEIADLIAGHEGEGSGARYGRGAALPVLKSAIEAIRYDEIDLKPALRLIGTLEEPSLA